MKINEIDLTKIDTFNHRFYIPGTSHEWLAVTAEPVENENINNVSMGVI